MVATVLFVHLVVIAVEVLKTNRSTYIWLHKLKLRTFGLDSTWMGLPRKTKAGLCCRSMSAKQLGGKLFQGVQALGKSGLCSRQLAGNCCKAVSRSSSRLNGTQLCEVMKMAKSCKEGAAANPR